MLRTLTFMERCRKLQAGNQRKTKKRIENSQEGRYNMGDGIVLYPNESTGAKQIAQDKKDPDNYGPGDKYGSVAPAMPGCKDSGKTSSFNKDANQYGNNGC